MPAYLRPISTAEALAALGHSAYTVLAGGTDYYPTHVGRPCFDAILDITAIPELKGIRDADDHWRIGATTTWSEILAAPLPAWFDGVKEAAREVGGVQIQNAGTIAGNLCNASPAADGVPPLLALDAKVELLAAGGIETLPLAEFLVGNHRTRRRPEQLVAAIVVPKPVAARAAGHFRKLGSRKYLVISFVMIGAALAVDVKSRIVTARVAVGACSPVARRLPLLEAALLGQPLNTDLGALAERHHLAPLAPISDVRADADYRRDAALTLVRRTLDELAARLGRSP